MTRGIGGGEWARVASALTHKLTLVMRHAVLLSVFALCSLCAAAITTPSWQPHAAASGSPHVAGLTALTGEAGAPLSAEEFLALTPRSYRERTGERLGLKGTIALKLAQRAVKKQQRDSGARAANSFAKGVYILLAVLGFGWLAMGLLDDFQGNNWLIGLLLYFLFYLPGLIYSLIKMDEYY